MQSGEVSMSQGDFSEGDGISRVHWDLNIPPELWGRSALDEPVEVEPPSVDIAVKQQGVCDENMVSVDPCPSTLGHADHKHELLLDSSIGLKIVLDHGEEKECLPVSHVDDSQQEDCRLECTPIDIAEDEGRSSLAGGTPGPETGSSLVNAYPVCAQGLGRVIEENKDAISVAELDVHTGGGCHLIEVESLETQGKNNVDMCTESEFGKMDKSEMFSHHAEEGSSSVLLERNSSCQAEVSHMDALDNGGCGPDDNSKPVMSSDSRCFTYQGSSDNVELSPGSASTAGHVPITIDMKMKTSKKSEMADENSNSAKFDASQYEEGEFRGTDVTNNWGGDETEDEEECADYGSDIGEMGVEAAGKVECKNMELSEVGYASKYSPLAGGNTQDIRSRLYLQDRSVSGIQDTGCSNRSAGRVAKDCDGTKRSVEFPERRDSASELNYSTSLDLKSSGRDRLSEGCRGSGDGTVDSDIHPADNYQTAATYNVSNVGESSKRRTVTASGKYLPSRIERPNVKASRSSEASEPDFKSGAFSRYRPSRRTDNTGRDDYWVDPRNHSEYHDSTGSYGTCDATRLGPKNAVASVTAELERKGFVVASDRTIFRAGSSRHRQSANASSQRTCRSLGRKPPVERGGEFSMQRGLENRELIPDRCTNISWCRNDRDSSRAFRTGYMEKYHANGPKHEQLYIREQSFSPRRRSPSKSRTCSPMWTPPRESRDHVMNRKTGKRRRSGSPYYKSQVMGERMRSQMRERSMSSQRQPDYKYIEDAPSARNQKTPLHASRWPDERDESPNRFREHRYTRHSHTRLDARGISHGYRFDPIRPPEIRRTDCYYCPMQSGRFPASTDVSRGPRHHSCGNRRSRQGNGRDVLHFMRERDIDGTVETLQNCVEDEPMSYHPESKVSSQYCQRKV